MVASSECCCSAVLGACAVVWMECRLQLGAYTWHAKAHEGCRCCHHCTCSTGDTVLACAVHGRLHSLTPAADFGASTVNNLAGPSKP